MGGYSFDDHARAVAAFAAAPFDIDRWTEGLDLFARAGGGWSAQLMGVDAAGGICFDLVTQMPADMVAEFERRGGGMVGVNPRAVSLLRDPYSITADDDYLDRGEQEASPFYQEVFAPSDARFMTIGRLGPHPGLTNIAGVIRSTAQGHSQRADHERIARLLPHVDAALRTQLYLGGQYLRTSLGSFDLTGMAAFFCDAAGRVVAMTDAGDALLRAGTLLHLRGGRLCAVRGHEDARLRAAHRRAVLRPGERGTPVRQSLFALVDGDGQVRRVSLSPVPAGHFPFTSVATLVTVGPAPGGSDPAALLREAFGLTPAESDIAIDLAKGLSSSDIAQARGRSVATVRVQVRSLLAKMDISKATAVAAIVGRLSG